MNTKIKLGGNWAQLSRATVVAVAWLVSGCSSAGSDGSGTSNTGGTAAQSGSTVNGSSAGVGSTTPSAGGASSTQGVGTPSACSHTPRGAKHTYLPATIIAKTESGVQVDWERLRVDDTHAYFRAKQQYFYRVPLSGGTPQLVGQLPNSDRWSDFVLTSDSLFALSDGVIWKLPKAGGNAETFVDLDIPGTLSLFRNLAVDGQNLYVIDPGSLSCEGQARVLSISLADKTKRVLLNDLDCPTEIAIDADNVYVTTSGHLEPPDFKPLAGKVIAVPKAGGASVVLRTGPEVARLRVDEGSNVFAMVGSQATTGKDLVRIPKSGGAPQSMYEPACQFDSDYLELHQGKVMFNSLHDLMLAAPDGTIEHGYTEAESHGLDAVHESIAFQGNDVYLMDYGQIRKYTLD